MKPFIHRVTPFPDTYEACKRMLWPLDERVEALEDGLYPANQIPGFEDKAEATIETRRSLCEHMRFRFPGECKGKLFPADYAACVKALEKLMDFSPDYQWDDIDDIFDEEADRTRNWYVLERYTRLTYPTCPPPAPDDCSFTEDEFHQDLLHEYNQFSYCPEAIKAVTGEFLFSPAEFKKIDAFNIAQGITKLKPVAKKKPRKKAKKKVSVPYKQMT